MRIGYVLYPGIEPIDLAALGVVSMARRVAPELTVCTVAARLAPVEFASGLRVLPDSAFAERAPCDVLVLPGGPGWQAAAQDAELLDYLRAMAAGTRLVTLCTGAMIAAAAGLLDDRAATTKVEVVGTEQVPLELLRTRHPRVAAQPALVVDSGAVVSGGGVSLCIDTMLYVLAPLLGAERHAALLRILEYGAAAEANRERLPVIVTGTAT